MKKRFAIALLLTGVLSGLSGCSRRGTESAVREDATDPILQERIEKDQAFRSSAESPIPERERPEFRGLCYFPLNPSLRFEVKLHRYSAPKQVRLGTNTGEVRRGLHYGYFEFSVDGKTCRLQVYRLDEGPDASLFIPFRDATSGKETYAGGRYIDLRENTSGIYDLDFNRAYNPYCAYNSEYSCPTPPEENTLEVAIRAGEKNCVPLPRH